MKTIVGIIALDERITNLEMVESNEKRIRLLEAAIANIIGRQDPINSGQLFAES